MNFKLQALLVFCILLLLGCAPTWEEYYNAYPETVNENVWNAMQSESNISQFIQILKDNELDTIFNSDIPYTVIVPSNEAVEAFQDTFNITLLKYHISSHLINSGSIPEKRQIQTLTNKFALYERNGNMVMIKITM